MNDPSSVFLFRDHLTFLDQVMRPEHVEMGLLDVANQLEKTQREFAAAKGIKLYGQLDQRLNLHGALSAAGSEAICHSKILEAHALPAMYHRERLTTRMRVRYLRRRGVARRRSSTRGSNEVRVELPRSFKVIVLGDNPET